MSLRLLHTADWHLDQCVREHGPIDPDGVPSRLKDQGKVGQQIVTHAIETEQDLVIFAGDAFRDPNPSSTARREFQSCITRLQNARIPVVCCVGNHDWSGVAGEATALDFIQDDGVHVFREPGVHEVLGRDGLPIAYAVGVPYFRRSHLLAREPNLSRAEADQRCAELAQQMVHGLLARVPRTCLPVIAVAHHNVQGAVLSSGYETAGQGDPFIPLNALDLDPFCYVACGHIHKHQRVSGATRPVWFAGSPHPLDFGEDKDPKGFIVAEVCAERAIPRDLTFIPTNCRRLLTIDLDFTAEEHPAELAPLYHYLRTNPFEWGSLKPVVRVRYSCRRDQRPSISHEEILTLLDTGGAWHVHSITPNIVDAATINRVEGIESTCIDPVSAAEAYLKAHSERYPATTHQSLLDRLSILLERDHARAQA